MSKRVRAMYVISIMLMAALLIAPLMVLPYLPDTIPAHYNAAGQVNRWGSKYELLITPITANVYSVIWMALGRLIWRKGTELTAEFIWMINNVVQLLVFGGVVVSTLRLSIHQIEHLTDLPLDLHRLGCIAVGLGMMAMGNYMPKLQKPSRMGLRTPWSVKNEAVWRKCQRFGGRSTMAAGAFSVLTALLSSGAWCWLWTGLAMTADCIAGVVYSWRISKTTPDE